MLDIKIRYDHQNQSYRGHIVKFVQVKNEFEGFKEKVRSELRELERLRDQAQKKYEKTKNIVLEEENKLKTYKTQLTEIKAQILARDKEPFWNIFCHFGVLFNGT